MNSSTGVVVLTLYLLATGVGFWLKHLNLSHLRAYGAVVPPEFQGAVDPALLNRISAYTLEQSRIGVLESIISKVLLVLFLFGGLLGLYDGWIASLTDSFILGGILFVVVLQTAERLLDIPFSIYHHFKIENRYGFNTITVRLWLEDLAKSIVISLVLSTLVVAGALFIIVSSPHWWWLWLWAFFLVFGIFMMYLSPYVIEPLFFKFEPVKAEGLEERVRVLMEQAGLKVSRLYQVDASRRSRHSNAYFTGIGRVKRIVLFDTLIQQMTQDEILSVLAHEIGHWKKHHVIKKIVIAEASAFLGLFIAFYLIQWGGLPNLVGLDHASFYARAVIVMFLSSLVTFPLTPLFSYLSRRDEREADHFAAALTKDPEAMASSLVKLSRENLSNLHPHPLYAAFYYSHPPVVQRVRDLRGLVTR